MIKRLKGIYTNCSPQDQPEGFYRDALNMDIDESVGALTNEKGTQQLFTLGAGESIKGSCLLPDNRMVFFIAGDTDRVAIYADDTLTTLTSQEFNFSEAITAVPYINQFNESVVFWVDGDNPARFINIDDPVLDSVEDYNLFPATDEIPEITITSVNQAGGSLEAGTYYIAAAYKHRDGSLTNFYTISNPVYITSNGEIGTKTAKSITFSLGSIDQTYESVQIAIVKKRDGVFDSVELLPELSVSSTTFTYTGNESVRPGALEEVQIDKAKYFSPKAIAYDDDNLFLGNMKDLDDLGFQPYANKIRVEAVTKTLSDVQDDAHFPKENSYNNPLIAATEKGFRRGEVYAFYISLLLKDGTQTKAYHIPGRDTSLVAGTSEGSTIISSNIPEFVPTTTGVKAFSRDIKVINTVANEGNVYIRYDSNTLSVLLEVADSKAEIATKIVNAINGTAWDIGAVIDPSDDTSFIIEDDAEGTGGNGKVITFGFDDIVDRTRTFVTGTTPRTFYGEGDPIDEFDIDYSYKRILTSQREVLTSGEAAAALQAIVTVESPQLSDSFTVALSADQTPLQAANAIRDELNGDAGFAAKYTASTQSLFVSGTYNRTDLRIIADATGDTYNGDVVIEFSWGVRNTITLTGGTSYTETDEYTSNDLGITDPKNFQFLSKPDPTYGMGYWQNSNETYPNTADWITADAGEDLRGTPVRHHQFPDSAHSPYMDETGSQKDYSVMGFKLVNVDIPEAIADQVIGYKVYYAKRTEENKRVLDTVLPIPATVDNGVYRPTGSVKISEIDDDVYYTHPFSYLRNKTNVGALTHLKSFGSYGSDPTKPIGGSAGFVSNLNFDRLGNTLYDALGNVAHFHNEIKTIKIEAAAYVDSEAEAEEGVNLGAFGFEKNINNFGGESKLVLRIPDTDPYRLVLRASRQMCNLCSHKSEVYNSFDEQILVDTGYIHTDMINQNSGDIFGGDTFITPYFYRTVRRRTSGNAEIVFRQATIESSDNINFRQAGENPWEYFFPKCGIRLWSAVNFSVTGEPRINDDDINYYDNYIGYTDDFSSVNDVKFPEIYRKIPRTTNNHITRVIRNSGGIRTFKVDDFVDLNKKRGELVKLSTYNNILIPHMERTLVRTKGKEDLQVNNFRAFVGSGDIFQVKPDEIIYSEDGFGGIQDKQHAISTPFGYYFVDKQAKRMYALTHDGMGDITEHILPDFRGFTNNIKLGYNPHNERIHISDGVSSYSYSPKTKGWVSRHSYIPDFMFNDLEYMYSAKGLTFNRHDVGDPGSFYGAVADSSFTFIKNSPESHRVTSLLIDTEITLNYNYKITITDPTQDFSGVTISDGTDNAGNVALTAGNGYSARLIAAVLATEVNADLDAKAYADGNVIYISSEQTITLSATPGATLAEEEGSVLNEWSTFDQYHIQNSKQSTDNEGIIYFKDPLEDDLENIYIGNARRTKKYWIINNFRDVTSVPSDVDPEYEWAYKPRMEDKYHSVELVKNNQYKEDMIFYSSDLIDKTSIR